MATHRDPTGAAGGDSGGADSEGGDVAGGGSPGLEPESPGVGPRAGNGPNYKRASRKGAPRRFACPYASCDKVYSRAEHLQRHQLNHNPKEIFECDVPDCGQKFVRLDLLARHKKRHSSSYIPRNRVPNFTTGPATQPTSTSVNSPTRISGPGPSPGLGPGIQHQQPPQPHQQQQQHHQHQHHQQPHQQPHPPHQATLHSPPQQQHQQQQPPQHQTYPQHAPRGPYNSSVLLTPSSNPSPLQTTLPHPGPPRLAHSNSWAPPPINDMGMNNMMHPKPGGFFSARDAAPLPGPTSMMAYGGVSEEQFARSNFAVWLFDPQTPFSEFSGVANIPFLEGGLESTFNNNIHYDYESLTGSSQMDPTPPRQMEGPDDLISEARRQEILRMFQLFRKKTDKYESRIVNLVHESGGDLPALNLEMMRDCIQEYWESVSPRLPIIHQPTFSANRCPILLLMVMVALGAASLRSRDGGGSLQDYGAFADVIIEGTRWEILMAEESIPPVALWVAQALLLLEFYEKLYSSRRFHERAHIYHTATLNFLRRGSPLIGRAGSESPPEDPSPPPPTGTADGGGGGGSLDSRMWWIRWAESESMHRVVFVAFMLDITHAAMFGHAADMGPHEIRLPLPCDDNLWTAPSPDICRQLDGNLRMYGVKQVSFLDGLKAALHGKEVKTHSFARMIIMSGLLSVGWHLSHRETHLKWLDARAPSAETRDNWRKMLLRAFDVWKVSFDDANGNGDSDARGATNGPIHSASVLYHLAHICLHVDIIDCQVYAGAKRLLGRKVSSRDYSNAVGRMRVWARQSSTRHAVLHAFRLLHRILVDPRKKGPGEGGGGGGGVPYTIRNDPDPHRPWIMYFASLTVCSFVRALNPPTPPPSLRPALQGVGGHAHHMDKYRRVGQYLASVASLEDLSEKTAAALYDGLPDLIDVLSGILNEAQPELLQEAHARFKTSKDLLMGVTTS
ncbi:related to C2H2 - zinc finger protein [Cephalotrichum gorgonifer]|uniref:Related to C2H2 - zinc finger protein n=1 Tax=Cephalotrichum gorgonifer TaxID=2041049 RepID=A0AAE8SYQ0_9PEZI|nr:related to C2H2 - zinc finger protein [Cephalotrichum gorgonifer]